MGKLGKLFRTGLGLAAVATAGAFYLYKKNPKVRRNTNAWASRMKKEILETLAELKEVNKETYRHVVDQVSARYGRLKDVNKVELKGLVADLKDAWGHFSKDLATLKDRNADGEVDQ
jgi:hypothetical protein